MYNNREIFLQNECTKQLSKVALPCPSSSWLKLSNEPIMFNSNNFPRSKLKGSEQFLISLSVLYRMENWQRTSQLKGSEQFLISLSVLYRMENWQRTSLWWATSSLLEAWQLSLENLSMMSFESPKKRNLLVNNKTAKK